MYGIMVYMAKGSSATWTPEADALIGTDADWAIAKILGVSTYTVFARRHKLGIPAFGLNAKIHWTPEMDACIVPTRSNKDIALQLGLYVRTVTKRRRALGIPLTYRKGRRAWTPEMDTLLGTASDQRVSEKLGVTLHQVRGRRLKLDIKSHREQTQIMPRAMSARTKAGRRFWQQRRRYRKLGLVNTLTERQWLFACRWFGFKCAYCGKQARRLTEDHRVPVSLKGGRTVLNILPACWDCNASKHDKPAYFWILDRFGQEPGKKILARIAAYLTEIKEQI